MLEAILSGVAPAEGYITNDTLAYLTFAPEDLPQGFVHDWVSNQRIATNVQKSLVNSIDEIHNVGQFNAAETVNFDIKRSIGSGDFTIELWGYIASENLSNVYMALSNQPNQSISLNQARISIGSNVGKLYTPTRYGTNNTTTADIPGNQYNHLCAQRKNLRTYVYLNGALVNEFAHTSGIVPTAFCLGAYTSGTRRFFKGQIAEAAISGEARYPLEGFTPKYPLFDM